MATSVLKYGVPLTFTFGWDTTVGAPHPPPYSGTTVKYAYTTTVKLGDADRTFALGPSGNQATFTLAIDNTGVYPGLVATCTNDPITGVQVTSKFMQLSFGNVSGASGYVVQGSEGPQTTASIFGYEDNNSAERFMAEQQTGSWQYTPSFAPATDPTASLDFYTFGSSSKTNITTLFLGLQVTVANAPAITAPDESLTVSEYYAPAPATSVVVTPAITQGGAPVTPDSLTIITQPLHGTASVNGAALSYSPGSGYSGTDSFTYKATVAGVYSNVATVTVAIVAVPTCQELGRATREYVSAYQRGRIHNSRLVRGEVRCLVANFNGAIPPSRKITGATWYCLQPYPIAMSNAKITPDGRTTQVTIAAQSQGPSILKTVVTLDNGEQYTQMFRVMVRGFPWFVGETVPPLGPYQLTVVAS